MKKTLFVFSILLTLVSCQSNGLNSAFEEDRQNFLNTKIDESVSSLSYFTSTITSTKKDDTYINRFEITSAKKEYKKVRLMITYDNKNVFFFGYNKDYILVDSKDKKDEKNGKYFGIAINFSSNEKIESLNVLFKCSEFSISYKIQA